MESLIEEDNTPSKIGASKRKLKKDRRLKRQEAELADGEGGSGSVGEVTWDEDQELSLLTQMGWSKCMGSTFSTGATASEDVTYRTNSEDGTAADAALQLQLDEPVETGEAAWNKLQLSAEEWKTLEQTKEQRVEERQKIREQLKQRFEEFCEKGAPPLASNSNSSNKRALGAAY